MKIKIKYEPLSLLNKQIKKAVSLREFNCLFSHKKNEIRLFSQDQYMGVIKYAKLNRLWNIGLKLLVVSNAGVSGEINLKQIKSDKDIKKYEKDFRLEVVNGALMVKKLFRYKSKAQIESMGIVDIMNSFELAGVLTLELISKIDEHLKIKIN